jgi:type IV pilus assembly protein PilW
MKHTRGFSLVELMIALLIGLIVVAGIISVFVTEHSVYRTASAQAAMQNVENGISFVVTPVLRSAGFAGCGNLANAVPLVTAAAALTYNLTLPVQGFDAAGTAGGGAFALATLNPANSVAAGGWTPALDATLVGGVCGAGPGCVEPGSDVVAVVGQMLGTAPVGVTVIAAGASNFTIAANANPLLVAGQIAAVSNCGNGSSFRVTSVAGNLIGHAAGLNTSAAFVPDYVGPGVGIDLRPQFVPLQQTAFFVGKGDGGQSALWQATLDGVNGGGGWTFQEMVPGVDNMQVLYGTGAGGVNTTYVAAGGVLDWTTVNSIRLGFLVEGPIGSAPVPALAPIFPVLGTAVTVPADTRLRHVYVMTVDVRNTTP